MKGEKVRVTKSGKVKYHPDHLQTLKPSPWEPHPKDRNLHRDTLTPYAEWKKRMDLWEQCAKDAVELED